MTNFFSRRNALGLGCDVAVGAVNGMSNGLFGSLLLTAAGSTLVVGSIAAVATACALGGAIAIIPAILLREQLVGSVRSNVNTSFLLRIATNTMLRTALAFSAGFIGAAIMGLAITPVVLSAMTGTLAFGLLSAITMTLFELGRVFTSRAETPDDMLAALW